MAETALFVGWGGVVPGRERFALEGYREWVTLLEELKEKGEIDSFVNVALTPHGGQLDGFTLVVAEQPTLLQLMQRDDVRRLQLQAQWEFARFSVVPASTGKLVEQEYALLEGEILPLFEGTPAAV